MKQLCVLSGWVGGWTTPSDLHIWSCWPVLTFHMLIWLHRTLYTHDTFHIWPVKNEFHSMLIWPSVPKCQPSASSLPWMFCQIPCWNMPYNYSNVDWPWSFSLHSVYLNDFPYGLLSRVRAIFSELALCNSDGIRASVKRLTLQIVIVSSRALNEPVWTQD